MTKDKQHEPAWTAHPGPEVTLRPATPGRVRNGRDGQQWYLDAERGWLPVVHKPEPERETEREAG
jgi:hypothetical protein